VAERGRGATVNDQPLAVSTTGTLDESLLDAVLGVLNEIRGKARMQIGP